MFSQQEVHVIGHDRTSVAGVRASLDDIAECFSDAGDFARGEVAQLVREQLFSVVAERLQISTRRLHFLLLEMDLTQVGNEIVANRFRHASTWIIRQSVTVYRPKKMIGGDHVASGS